MNGFAYDHGHQFLRGGHGDDAVHGQTLEHGQQHIAGSRGHVDEHIIDVSPVHFIEELPNRIGDNRSAPCDGHIFFGQHQVRADDFDAALRLGGHDAVGIGRKGICYPEGFGNGGAGHVGIQDSDFFAAFPSFASEQRSDEALAYAAFARYHADDVSDFRLFVGLQHRGPGCTLAAAIDAAAIALMRAFFSHASFFREGRL